MGEYSKAKIVGFITIMLILSLLIFITFKIVKSNREKQKEKDSYLSYKEEKIDTSLNGSFIQYVSLNNEYVEDGVSAFYNDEDISDNVIISYFSNDEQVFYIDVTRVGTYLVKYTVLSDNLTREVYKTVIVIDDKKPVISFPKKTVISVSEVKGFDLEKDVVVSDNSGNVKFDYDNTLEEKQGKYIITYKAVDDSGNKILKKRLIEVK